MPKVILKRSSVASNAPTTSDLDYGELALNYADGRLYYKTSSNAIDYFSTGSNVSDFENYQYTATASQTTFSGSDDNSNTLSYTAGQITVFVNGIKLAESDYTATNGTSVVLTSAASLNDNVEVLSYINLRITSYKYTATASQTTFSGSDDNSNILKYLAGAISVYLNGVKLAESDYTATNGTSVVLASGAAVNDTLEVVIYSNLAVPNLDIAGDTGTDNIFIGDETLTFSGTANEITTSVSGGTVTIGLPSSITVDVTGSLTGNADTATKLSSTRTFALTGDVTGTVDSDLTSGASITTAIAANSIVDADISTTAEILVSKLANGTARQLLQTDAAGTGVEWTSNLDVPGTLDVTGATTMDSTLTVTGDLNVGSGDLFVDDSTGQVGIGTTSFVSNTKLAVYDSATSVADSAGRTVLIASDTAPVLGLYHTGTPADGELTGRLDFISNNSSGDQFEWTAARIEGISEDATSGDRKGALNFKTSGPNGQSIDALRIDSSGNVGIGTTSPQRRLTVGAGGATSEVLSIYSGSGAASAIHFTDTNTTTDYQGFVNYSHGIDTMRFGTAETERMRIDSSGNVGIGTTSPQALLHLEGSNPRIRFRDTGSASGTYSEISADNTTGSLVISADSGTIISPSIVQFDVDGTERMQINAAYLRLSSSNSGIQFNGDTAAANALDDYEEGFLAAVLTPVTSGGISIFASFSDLGYTKIGRKVTVNGLIGLTNASSPIGELRVNLPFTSGLGNGDSGTRHWVGFMYDWQTGDMWPMLIAPSTAYAQTKGFDSSTFDWTSNYIGFSLTYDV